MNITITGASGFVGKNLSTFLESKDHHVTSLSLRNENWRNEFPMNGDAIIHLAGKAHDTSNTSDDQEYYKINRDLTIELFNKFLNSEIKEFFYFSSVKAVADRVDHVLIEEAEANPYTPYGKSKKEAEEYIFNQSLPEGKKVYIIRPCMIHGPGNKGNLNLLYKVVKKGLPWPLAAFGNKRSFLSIDNLNFLVNEILMNKNVSSGIYNFADDDAISTNDLIRTINSAVNKKAKLWSISKTMIEGMAKLGDKLHLPLNSERLKKLTESYVVSNQKIKTELKIKSLPVTVQEGLTKTIQSFNI
ncbi:NAD-dependent epimerase/dehydratase family protein [Chryseobacterium sp. PTM-20240506]|uniref:NAD-dependent epimerase/dehydratase family protein n=1 Tax=unclassified Chryseobacterium TaxID=2593645 RepID=UPI002358ECFB|nr:MULTISPECIES: NAD-dependent epimerase/dehydratase family protein [unclassified Chryseobacterium]MDC8105116.1 NAD-dependent epimerase/dehydratase family protein [Chryseobacterium sp. B21-037]MDQ1805373.1 NAD-dependent epimerase/dehydratase family protein [Chryseobacterium sp. CKR4-1]